MSETHIIDTDVIGDYVKYSCKISKSYIMFRLYNNTSYLEHNVLDWKYPKLIMNLIKYSFDDIVDKYKNIKYFIYHININELEYIDTTKFSQSVYDDIVELKCDMENAFENFIKGFITQ